MRAAFYESFGNPVDVLKVGDQPEPVPGPGQARLKVILSAIHNHDVWTVRGDYGVRPDLPAIGGTELVGVVDAVGDGVDSALIGRRVSVASAKGAWAEKTVVPTAALCPVPDAVPDEVAAQLLAMPFSALVLLESLHLNDGDWIVQNAASGAVGRLLTFIARTRGIHVLNLVRRDAAVEELKEIGITTAVSTESPDWKSTAMAITGGNPILIGIDSVGGDAIATLADLVAENGSLISFGNMTGNALHFSPGPLIFKQLTLKGFWASKAIPALPAADRIRMITELVTLAATGKLPLPVDSIYNLEDICNAVARSLTPGKTGKVLVRG